jgi:hypothetical protein
LMRTIKTYFKRAPFYNALIRPLPNSSTRFAAQEHLGYLAWLPQTN